MEIPKKGKYYVYELIEPTTKKVFYVGKGHGYRIFQHEKLYESDKNTHKKNKIKKILNNGCKIIYNIVFIGSEKECLEKEVELIALYGKNNLTNKTQGGEGTSGYILSKETKQKISKSRKGQFSGDKHPLFGKRGEQNPNFGKKRTKKTKDLLRFKNLGNLNCGTKGEKHHMYGKNHSEETKQKISKTKKQNNLHKGSNNGRSKLTNSDILNIRKEYPLLCEKMGISKSIKFLCEKYNIKSYSSMDKIVKFKSWLHV